jgi:hypothetical protein
MTGASMTLWKEIDHLFVHSTADANVQNLSREQNNFKQIATEYFVDYLLK